jgi:hypothetical protein
MAQGRAMTTYATVSIECPNCVRLRQDLAAARELLEGARRFIDNVAVVANIDAFLRREETSDIGPARGE